MLGSVADAEDVVQDAFLRWLDADRAAILEPVAVVRGPRSGHYPAVRFLAFLWPVADRCPVPPSNPTVIE
jgi:hypothetical protein